MEDKLEKIAFLFPGVGAQHTGMGKSFYQKFPVFRKIFEEASDILKTDMAALCFDQQHSRTLSNLKNAQCALLSVSYGIFMVFMEEIGLEPDYCLGHSLGEYSALCAAGIIKFGDALKLVKIRGEIINEAAESIDGAMAWVINTDVYHVEKLCAEKRKTGEKIYVSAYDSPDQCSISGERNSLYAIAKSIEAIGGIVYPLPLSGPFHCPLMKKAALAMKKELQNVYYTEGRCDVLANYNTEPYKGPASIPFNLSQQLVQPVRWRQAIQWVAKNGVSHAIEMGPKEILKFLMAKTAVQIKCFLAGDEKQLATIAKNLFLPESEYIHTIGLCLGAIASTPNLNTENIHYHREVTEPYRLLKDIYIKARNNEVPVSMSDVKTSLGVLRSVLCAKNIPAHLQEIKLSKIMKQRILGACTNAVLPAI